MTLHPHVAGLFFLEDPDWRRKLWRGGLTVVTPFIGWHIVLGYRRHLIAHLCAGPDALPEWRGNSWRHFVDGCKATCVIFAYLAPLHAALLALVIARGFDPTSISPWIPLLFLALPFLLPVSLPFALTLFSITGWIAPVEASLFLAAFAAVVFVVPAAFLQVSRTGRFRSAFRVGGVATFLARNLPTYSAAWRDSAPIAIAAHLALPIAPWSVVWAYCSVMFLFNEVIVVSGEHAQRGWIVRARADPRWAPASRFGLRTVRDAAGENVHVLELGAFSAPLPWRSARSGA